MTGTRRFFEGIWSMLLPHVSTKRLVLAAVLVGVVLFGVYVISFGMRRPQIMQTTSMGNAIALPEPEKTGIMSVEEAISKRRSIREYSKQPLTLHELSQLLWSAQGVTDRINKLRAAPSAGATYPIDVYVVVGEDGVVGLRSGVYRYVPSGHEIYLLFEGDVRNELSSASLGQTWIAQAPVDLVITAVYERMTSRYGDRGIRYVHMKAGHVAENIYLEATALNLGTVAVGAFNDEKVQKVLRLPEENEPLYVMPVGHI
jgi:SagB-type dehydrogenase family enzyme